MDLVHFAYPKVDYFYICFNADFFLCYSLAEYLIALTVLGKYSKYPFPVLFVCLFIRKDQGNSILFKEEAGIFNLMKY